MGIDVIVLFFVSKIVKSSHVIFQTGSKSIHYCTPDAESSIKTEKPRFFAFQVLVPIASLFPFHLIRESWNFNFVKVHILEGFSENNP